MTWNTLDNLTTGQLATETHLDEMRENIEHVGAMQFAGVALSALATGTSAARIAVGSFTGNGSDNRAVTGIGFTPKSVKIVSATIVSTTTGGWVLRFGHAGDLSNAGDTTWSGASAINVQSLDSDGFTLGNSQFANQSGTTYYYEAIG